jgi:PAS domain S-box-containing protein
MGVLYSQRVKARALGYLIAGVAVFSWLMVAVPHATTVNETGVLILAPVTLLIGVAVATLGARGGEPLLQACTALGTVLVAWANHFVGPSALSPILYTWMALYAFAFFRRRDALLHMVFIGATYIVVLTGQPMVTSPVVRWILAIGTPLVGGLLISRIVRLATTRTEVLADSERRVRAIVESAPDAFITIDDSSTILAWNREAERTFGYTASEALGRHLADVILEEHQKPGHEERRDAVLAAPAEDAPTRYERELRRRDGSLFPAEITLKKVVVDEQAGLVVFARDVSERLEREREREQLYREQTARQEAEQMAAMVHGLQMLLDAALAHSRPERMMEALLPRLREVLDADVASIFIVNGDSGALELRASTGGVPAETLSAGPEHLSARVRGSRAPLLVNNPSPDELADPAMRSMNSVIAVPLMAGGDVTGVILVGVGAPRTFDDDALLLLGLAADRVALALSHAIVFEREHNIAETLQRSLLPERLPTLPGLEVAARYLPAASEAEVGGDWYDVIPLDSSRVGLVMGDVAGKGLSAASMVGRLRSALRAYAMEGHEPAEVVTRLNQLLWSEVEDTEMATLVYVVVDPAEATVRWINAGHPPPLVLGGDQPEFLEGGRSVPLGVMPFPAYEEATAPLPGGRVLLLYTDGLVERPGEILDAGFQRLADAVADSECGADALCNHVLAQMVPHGAMADDVALLSLFAPELSDEFTLELPPDADQLASMRALLRRWLHHAESTDSDTAEILMATGEAAANAIEHANTGGAPFRVAGVVEDGQVEIVVSDRGAWRPERDNGRGRGLTLMRELMDRVDVEQAPEGTTVRMRKRLRTPAPS